MSARGRSPEGRDVLLEAARRIARRDTRESEAVVLRLLRDPRSGVAETMTAALLEARREAAMPLILRCLGQDRAAGQGLLEGMLDSELDGLDIRGAIVSILLTTDDRDEIVGALSAIGWLAPAGGFPSSPAVLARVSNLCEGGDEPIRVLARAALTALALR